MLAGRAYVPEASQNSRRVVPLSVVNVALLSASGIQPASVVAAKPWRQSYGSKARMHISNNHNNAARRMSYILR
jgi:hypothetical protein